MLKRYAALLAAAALALAPARARAKTVDIVSPGKRIRISVTVGDRIRYAVFCDGAAVVEPSAVSMTVNGADLGLRPALASVKRTGADRVLLPVVREKRREVRDRYAEAELRFKAGFGVRFRAYDDGAAYRFVTRLGDSVVVDSELAEFRFPGDPELLIPVEPGFHTSFERLYDVLPLKTLGPERKGFLPMLVTLSGGRRAALTEAHLEDYPGMFLAGAAGGAAGLTGVFAPCPAAEEEKNDRVLAVTRTEPYIARTAGDRVFPWRVIALPARDGGLIETDLVYRLAPEQRLKDASWIRPGKVAWDWWNALNLHGVDFKSGVNTETYLHFIDFAAEHGIEYIVLDEGWSSPADLSAVNPAVDMDAVFARARAKNVGVILWMVFRTLDKQFEAALDRFQAWGAAGLKIDFMDRDDQKMVRFYWKVAERTAEHRLLVDFHGAYKPTGLRRAWPNVITREGVRGSEYNKWADDESPEYDVTLPFVRMLAGPLDYTPGAMRNAAKGAFRAVFEQPMSQGTRCHQLAMYVVYESPLQMLCDSPSAYRAEPDVMRFLGPVPTVWDETVALDGRVADFVVVARRSGADWYVGAMTDWTPRDVKVDLSFLGPGRFRLEAFADGVNADRWGSDFTRSERGVTSSDVLDLRLAPGGGWAGRIVKF
jgi:alpha-glucosidase